MTKEQKKQQLREIDNSLNDTNDLEEKKDYYNTLVLEIQSLPYSNDISRNSALAHLPIVLQDIEEQIARSSTFSLHNNVPPNFAFFLNAVNFSSLDD